MQLHRISSNASCRSAPFHHIPGAPLSHHRKLHTNPYLLPSRIIPPILYPILGSLNPHANLLPYTRLHILSVHCRHLPWPHIVMHGISTTTIPLDNADVVLRSLNSNLDLPFLSDHHTLLVVPPIPNPIECLQHDPTTSTNRCILPHYLRRYRSHLYRIPPLTSITIPTTDHIPSPRLYLHTPLLAEYAIDSDHSPLIALSTTD
jgi:hypothetical protein